MDYNWFAVAEETPHGGIGNRTPYVKHNHVVSSHQIFTTELKYYIEKYDIKQKNALY